MDTRVLLVAILTSMASALVFGLAPALRGSNPDLAPALKSEKGESGKRRPLLGRNGLVVAQVAGSLVLLVFATQAYRGASMILSGPVGFRTGHLLIASFDPSLARYTLPQAKEFHKRLLDTVRAPAGGKSAALAQDVPMGVNGGVHRIVLEGAQLAPGADAVPVLSNDVSDGYFEPMGIPILEGRDFLKMLTRAIAGISILGLVLALVGLYGLISYSVGLRQREIGLCIAIGAEPAGILRMVLKQGLMLASIGIAIGGTISLMAGQPVTRLIETDGFNLPFLVLAACGLLVATCGAFIPAHRASLLDPNKVLRQDLEAPALAAMAIFLLFLAEVVRMKIC